MASIARCLRAVRPSTLSRVPQTPRVRPNWQATGLRAFSASPIRDIRKYTKDHEWVDLNADQTTGVIGISEYAAQELGDVVYVELPEEGKELLAGDTLGAVESVKSAADINSPISCTVTHANGLLEEKPGTINEVPEDDSHGGGWIAKVTVSEQGRKDFEALMDLNEYKDFTGSEEH
ncbi:glycine cleavage system H protein [Xylaria bambusicola]|uniref:glycine cleavage system H protein n=1 Tax=Xylaria bambusicola TaxID=326684 RepID=UPI002007AB0D|nr:glycine cleavage system H protein [Xylaria bambusicola]KAI0517610.1 glycine cleavage system H protein [Xylaria bambusicola]